MTEILSKQDIIIKLAKASKEFSVVCSGIQDELFFYPPADKWSIAQHAEHLIIATKRTLPAFTLPKFIVRWYMGKPNRLSCSYGELVAKYKKQLEKGYQASGRFVPEQIAAVKGKEKIIYNFSKSINQLINALDKNWNEAQLDQYIAPHPLLGKITLRELSYFTIYPTYHHLHTIKERLKN